MTSTPSGVLGSAGPTDATRSEATSLRGESAAFSTRSSLSLVVHRYTRALLSIPALQGRVATLGAKDLLRRGPPPTDGKYTTQEHVEHLAAHGLVNENKPLLVFGMRNSLVNHRCIVLLRGASHALAPEQPEQSARAYYGIGVRRDRDRLAMGAALGGTSGTRDWEFFCSGLPVLWDGRSEASMSELMLAEAADHSHFFALPRGNHPRATDESRAAWSGLHQVFMNQLHSSEQSAAGELSRAALPLALEREDGYLHQVLAVDQAGRLLCHVAHGRLEDLGRPAKGAGFERAVCVENSGSVQPTFYPAGVHGEAIALLHAPNFRPKGRAVLVLELDRSTFDRLP